MFLIPREEQQSINFDLLPHHHKYTTFIWHNLACDHEPRFKLWSEKMDRDFEYNYMFLTFSNLNSLECPYIFVIPTNCMAICSCPRRANVFAAQNRLFIVYAHNFSHFSRYIIVKVNAMLK